MNKMLKSILASCLLFVSLSATATEATAPTLFDRLGGETGVTQIVADTFANHKANPIVQNRFAYSDPTYVKQRVYEIFAMATGSTDVKYDGDLAAIHSNMNISEMEFNAVVDDVLSALATNKVAQQEQNEVLAILWGARPAIVNMNVSTQTLTAPAAPAEAAHAH